MNSLNAKENGKMKFQLMSAKYWSDFKRLLNDYPQIANEFKIQIIDTTQEYESGNRYIDSEVYIMIDTLEDLIRFIDIVDESVMFNGDEILIYDDYIE